MKYLRWSTTILSSNSFVDRSAKLSTKGLSISLQTVLCTLHIQRTFRSLMLNPLVDSLAGLSINELEDKIVVLQRRYFMTGNPGVQQQIQNFLEIYQEEVQTRRAIEYNRQKNAENGETGLDKLINVS